MHGLQMRLSQVNGDEIGLETFLKLADALTQSQGLSSVTRGKGDELFGSDGGVVGKRELLELGA